mmetsp:Transcript_18356/g.52445  ORF Transcript_18356/g.52445 Transcript_18356/m.52445 type:complete len:582 (+) Transcript_18356:294-2039(+)
MNCHGRCISSRTALAVLLVLACCSICRTEATITIIDTEKRLPSKPDRKIGASLWKGYEYLGHLQYIHDNLPLCGDKTWNVTLPRDNVPVALIVKKGTCSIEEKARVASTQIHPKNVVRYIIVDGENSIKENDDAIMDMPPLQLSIDTDSIELEDLIGTDDGATMDSRGDDMIDVVAPIHNNNNVKWWGNADDDDSNDDESAPIPMNDRALRKRHKKKDHSNDDITVAVLHVSYTSGYLLLDYALQQNSTIQKHGGPKILLDSQAPSASRRTIFLWVLLSASLSASACCCLLLFIRTGFLDEPQPPPRPRRRRLTNEQVRVSYPHYPYSDADSPNDGQFHECSICLDEFEDGVRIRKLPCGHVFHANCIARWLIERSATCPLCKIDLYEGDDEEEETNQEGGAAPQGQEEAPATLQNVPEWLTRRIAAFEQDMRRRQEERRSWWSRRVQPTTTTTTAASSTSPQQPQAQNAAADIAAAPSASVPTPSPQGSQAPSTMRSSSWIRRFFRSTRATPIDRPASTELTEPLLQPGASVDLPNISNGGTATNDTGTDGTAAAAAPQTQSSTGEELAEDAPSSTPVEV